MHFLKMRTMKRFRNLQMQGAWRLTLSGLAVTAAASLALALGLTACEERGQLHPAQPGERHRRILHSSGRQHRGGRRDNSPTILARAPSPPTEPCRPQTTHSSRSPRQPGARPWSPPTARCSPAISTRFFSPKRRRPNSYEVTILEDQQIAGGRRPLGIPLSQPGAQDRRASTSIWSPPALPWRTPFPSSRTCLSAELPATSASPRRP